MLPNNDCDNSPTSNPHRRSHRRLRVRDNRQGAGGETPLSKTQRGGIRHAVVQSLAIAVARRARARPLPPGPRPGPSRHHCRPPLPPTRAEPRPPHLVPSGLDTRPPHPCREFREPPCPPPRLPPMATMTSTTSAASTPRWTRRRRTTGRGPPSPCHRRSHRPQRGGGCRTQRPVTPGITQPLCQVPPHDHTSSLSLSVGNWRGGSRGGGGCRARRQRQKRQRLLMLLEFCHLCRARLTLESEILN